jgi:O-antigen/teichoic acid export membrane protein
MGWQVWKNENRKIKNVTCINMIEKAKKYREFPIYAAPASLLDAVSLQAPLLVLSYFYNAEYVGLFSLTIRVLAMPATLIGTAVGRVYHQRIAEARNSEPERLRSLILKSAKYLGLVVSGPVLVLVLFAPALFSFIFGEVWRDAGRFAQIIALAIGFRFVVSPLSTIIIVSGNIKLGAIWQVTYFISSFTTLIIAAQFSIEIFMIVFSIHEILLYSLYFCFIIRASGRVR